MFVILWFLVAIPSFGICKARFTFVFNAAFRTKVHGCFVELLPFCLSTLFACKNICNIYDKICSCYVAWVFRVSILCEVQIHWTIKKLVYFSAIILNLHEIRFDLTQELFYRVVLRNKISRRIISRLCRFEDTEHPVRISPSSDTSDRSYESRFPFLSPKCVN